MLLLKIENLSVAYPHKICFDTFSADLHDGDRVAVVGGNGTGKTSLLKKIVELPSNAHIGYVPQTVEEHGELSGGERFNRALTVALAGNPDILLLDEPTNHLDSSNRQSLKRFIKKFRGAIIAASHDLDFINNSFNTIWHISDGKIRVFRGKYDDYIADQQIKRRQIEQERVDIKRDKRELHENLMREQKRAKNSKIAGENKSVPRIVAGGLKRQAQKTSSNKKSAISGEKEALDEKLNDLHLPTILKPKFILPYKPRSIGTAVHIVNGAIGYTSYIIEGINLTVGAGERLAIVGDNGSGKSTLIKGILSDPSVIKRGEWYLPPIEAIGYLDQHYTNLIAEMTVLENATHVRPDLPIAEIRSHLNDFLFRKNEEVSLLASSLSGGEKARLSLALMALNAPALIVLDEVTNNIDLITREHITQILNEYMGALIVVSHDRRFLKEIGVEREIYLIPTKK